MISSPAKINRTPLLIPKRGEQLESKELQGVMKAKPFKEDSPAKYNTVESKRI